MVDTDEVLASWDRYPSWVVCTGQADALWSPDDTRRQQNRGGFDDYVAHLGDEFVWLTLARPLPADHVDRELVELAGRIPELRIRERDEASRIAPHRASGRYRDLARARTTGLWHVRVLVASGMPAAARRAAALLCGAADLDDLPYALAPSGAPMSFSEALATTVVTADGHAAPFPATTELLAVLARPPKRELPGSTWSNARTST